MQYLDAKLDSLHFPTVRLLAGALAAISLLSGCATGKSIKNADDIVDDGKRNSMLFSYDIALNVTDKHPKVGKTTLIIGCGEPNSLGVIPECFRLRLPLEGRRDIDGFGYYTFRGNGSKVLQMPYGLYNFESMRHSVVVDVQTTVNCTTNKKGRTTCRPVSNDVSTRHLQETPAVAPFEIEPGVGCYAGHLTLEMNDSAIVNYSFDQSATQPSDDVVAALPGNIQDAVRARVTQPCVPG